MTKDTFIKQLLKMIFETDADGYPLPAHTKIAKLQIFADKYKSFADKYKGE